MRCIVLWFPAFAGMTVRDAGMTVRVAGNDGPGVAWCRLSESGFWGILGIYRIETMRCIVLWVPASAGNDGEGRGNDGLGARGVGCQNQDYG